MTTIQTEAGNSIPEIIDHLMWCSYKSHRDRGETSHETLVKFGIGNEHFRILYEKQRAMQLIPQDFVDYLTANGYHVYVSDGKRTISCMNGRRSVEFKNDRATFLTYYGGSHDESPDFTEYGSAEGISGMDIFKFQLLMHAFDVVPLQDFIKRAKLATAY